jgi:hypothetical protein
VRKLDEMYADFADVWKKNTKSNETKREVARHMHIQRPATAGRDEKTNEPNICKRDKCGNAGWQRACCGGNA